MCVLPVLLSWFGPAPYLNATNIYLSSHMSLRLKALSSLNESRPHQKLATSISTTQDREQYKPAALRPHSLNKADLRNNLPMHNIELQKLSEDINESLSMLETQAENNVPKEPLVLTIRKPSPVITEQPKSHEDIIKDCEDYLLEQEQASTSREQKC